MMSLCRLVMLILLFAVSTAASAREIRIWTDKEGRKIEAALIGASASEARLRMKNSGKEYKVPLNHLSPADQAYIKKEMAKPQGPRLARIPLGFENWNDDWPKLISGTVSPEIEIAEENEAGKRFVYRSPRYEYICDDILYRPPSFMIALVKSF